MVRRVQRVAAQQTAKIPSQLIAGWKLRRRGADRRGGYQESGARRSIKCGRHGQKLSGLQRRVSAPKGVQAPFGQGPPEGRGVVRRGHRPGRDEKITKISSQVMSGAKR